MIQHTPEWLEGYRSGLMAGAQGLSGGGNLRGGGGASASLGTTTGTGATTIKPARRSRTSTRGGTPEQHAQAGHEGGLATAKKRRGRATGSKNKTGGGDAGALHAGASAGTQAQY